MTNLFEIRAGDVLPNGDIVTSTSFTTDNGTSTLFVEAKRPETAPEKLLVRSKQLDREAIAVGKAMQEAVSGVLTGSAVNAAQGTLGKF